MLGSKTLLRLAMRQVRDCGAWLKRDLSGFAGESVIYKVMAREKSRQLDEVSGSKTQ